MNRDELIDKVEELFWESPFMQLGEPRDLAKVVIPLIEADLRERLAEEIEAMANRMAPALVPDAPILGAYRSAASIVRGASADTDPAQEDETP